jgi:hypothetical protein
MTKIDEREPMAFEQDVLDLALGSLRAGQDPRPAPATRRPRRRRRTVIAIAAAGLALAIAIPIALPGGVTGGADPAAAAVLHRVALRAAKQPPEPTPGPGQYLYTRSESAPTLLYVVGDGNTFLFRFPMTRESWLGHDGSGRIRNTWGPVTFPSAEDREKWTAAGSPDLYEVQTDGDLHEERSEDDRFARGELNNPNRYADLPADPDELLELIESRELGGGPRGDWQTFSIIGDLLREASPPPKVRAALYQVAAELPGVELLGAVVDGAGRPGVAVAYTNPSSDSRSRMELIFDPTTAELLGWSEVLVADSTVDVESGGPGAIYGAVGPAGTKIFMTTYLVSGVVDSTTETI